MEHNKSQQEESSALPKESKQAIKVMFLTLFLDLVGFSIIFPLFPALADYYLTIDPDNIFLQGILSLMHQLGQGEAFDIVLFGGILGALYSLLQFIFAPFWGRVSDRIGRKPTLLFTVSGMFLSYVVWFFAGNFTLLIIGRVLAGIMGGNLSVATAVMADVTTEKTRSRAMAFVGIAFALGFIIGPALGGIFTQIDLSHWGSDLINPFSGAALVAAILSFINIYLVAFKFKETLSPKNKTTRNFNLKQWFWGDNSLVNKTNLAYFMFILAFSGMEFTLTFLAVERLNYTSWDNAKMFVFIGVILTLVQGGYVRRKAAVVGEKQMALRGLVILIPGLLILSQSYNSYLLYLGLFFLAVGSSLIVPTLTSLVSLFSKADEQGQNLGSFRSVGSLGRVFGPLVMSYLYWRFGADHTYIFGAALLFLPIFILSKIPFQKRA